MKYLYILLTMGLLMSNAMSEVTVIENDSPTATAVWDANTDGVTTGYWAHFGTLSNTYTNRYDATITSLKFLDLSYDKVYYTAVQAYDKNGNTSPMSNEVAFKIVKPVPVIQKYVVVSTSKDKGKTWIALGQVVVPPPYVVGQTYKYSVVTMSTKPTLKSVNVLTSKDKSITWTSIGSVAIPPPYVTGQKYKINIVTK